MNKKDIAIEEMKLLQAVIARHDDISFKIKGWCITLNMGIVTALYGMGNNYPFLFIIMAYIGLCFVTCFFIWMEAIYRVAMDRAIQRSTEVETEIRKELYNEKEYPQINKVLGRPNKIRNQIKVLSNIRVVAPYYIIFIIDFIGLLIKYLVL